MAHRFKKVTSRTKYGWSDWQQPILKGYRAMCCDCGLIHRVEFRLNEYKGNFKIQFRVARERPSVRGKEQHGG